VSDQHKQVSRPDPRSVRARLERALAGDVIQRPVYAAYDWFIKNRAIDWGSLFEQGLGQIAHADLVQAHRPNVEIVETTQEVDGQIRRDVRWITDRGELHEWYLGEWHQECFIKKPDDYRIMRRAWEGTHFTVTSEPFEHADEEVGDTGITLGHLGWAPLRRTPEMTVQIEFAGLERFTLDLADEQPELMELLELLTEVTLQKCRVAAKGPARYIKLWENMSIEMIGPRLYRQRLVPVYRQILEIFSSAGKRLVVHYDGKLRSIADDIAELGFDLDSFTPPPQGDMSTAEARACWPEKFLWLHPPLDWFRGDQATLVERILQMVRDAGPRRYCFMISEDVPPAWEQNVPAVLQALDTMRA